MIIRCGSLISVLRNIRVEKIKLVETPRDCPVKSLTVTFGWTTEKLSLFWKLTLKTLLFVNFKCRKEKTNVRSTCRFHCANRKRKQLETSNSLLRDVLN